MRAVLVQGVDEYRVSKIFCKRRDFLQAMTYSIITATHNDVQLGARLLASIPRRDDLEFVLVNDHSDMPHIETARAMLAASGLPHIQFIDNPYPGSLGTARNCGLEHARGDFVLFADIDDFFTGAFDTVLDRYADIPHDLVVFRKQTVTDSGEAAGRDITSDIFFERYKKQPTDENLLALCYHFFPVWSKLYRKRVIDEHRLRFDADMPGEEINFTARFVFYAKDRVVDCDHEIYCCVERKGSITSGARLMPERLRGVIARALERDAFLRAHETARRYHIARESSLYYVVKTCQTLGFRAAWEVCGEFRKRRWPLIDSSHVSVFARQIRLKKLKRMMSGFRKGTRES
jgi:glycosyltransferase involved in cell wall biosynthesis